MYVRAFKGNCTVYIFYRCTLAEWITFCIQIRCWRATRVLLYDLTPMS